MDCVPVMCWIAPAVNPRMSAAPVKIDVSWVLRLPVWVPPYPQPPAFTLMPTWQLTTDEPPVRSYAMPEVHSHYLTYNNLF